MSGIVDPVILNRMSKLKQRHEATKQQLRRLEDEMEYSNVKKNGSEASERSEYNYSEQSVVTTSTPDVSAFGESRDGIKLPRGKNKSFTAFEVREIDRHNAILMNKISSHTRKPSQYRIGPGYYTKVSNSQVNRRKKQEQIDRENMILLKKIQTAKPCGLSMRK